MRKIIISLFVLLLLGTLFAWTNLIIELVSWLNNKACATGCTGGIVKSPFVTPCFYGALVFLVCFILSAILLKKSRKT